MAHIRISKQALLSMIKQLDDSGMDNICISSPSDDGVARVKMIEHLTSLHGHHVTSKFDIKDDEQIGHYYGHTLIDIKQ